MTLFNPTIGVDADTVAALVLEHWHVRLGKRLKASQNHTFEGEVVGGGEEGSAPLSNTKVAVRVTPLPDDRDDRGRIVQRILDELTFVRYVANHPQGPRHVCAPIAQKKKQHNNNDEGEEGNSFLLVARSMAIVVSEWAIGNPVNFMDFKSWMDTRPQAAEGEKGSNHHFICDVWGRSLGRLHHVSRCFAEDQPIVAKRIQSWDAVHERIMARRMQPSSTVAGLAPLVLDERDTAMMDNPLLYGVLHGDLNISNFFYFKKSGEEETFDTLSVFDWDQTQRGWFMSDVAQSAFTVFMLKDAGMFGAPSKEDDDDAIVEVPEADPIQFSEWLLDGYDSWWKGEADASVVKPPPPVDRAHYFRMVDLRHAFYETFCREALLEAERGEATVPADMLRFIEFVAKWFDKRRKRSDKVEPSK